MKLFIQQQRLFRVSWQTEAKDVAEGRAGLARFLADRVGRTPEIDLLETMNDTSFLVDARFRWSIDRLAVNSRDRHNLIERIGREGSIESWNLRPLMLAAVERDWLPGGQYLVEYAY